MLPYEKLVYPRLFAIRKL